MKSKLLLIVLSTILAAVSCSKDGSQDVYFSVTPSEIAAPHTLSSQEFEVQSNVSWTVKVLSAEGYEIYWTKPNREKGHGNSSVSLRVYENDYKNDRTAHVAVISETGDTSVVLLTQAGNPDSDVTDSEITVRIGTYNLRVKSGKDTGDYAWDKRKPRLITSIYDNDFDVFGVNECNTDVQNHINENLKNDYNIKYFSPYSQNGIGDRAQGIVYKKHFTLLDWHYFWLSETPDIMVANDPSGDSVYNRGGCCGTLVHNETGVRFFVMVTHGATNQSVRDKYAHVYIDMEKKYNPNGYPSFFVGDMNARPAQNSVATYLTYWKDVYLEVGKDNITGPFSTYNDFNTSLDLNKDPRRIDYIYYRNATPLNYVCNDATYEGCYASDHLPVYSDMKIKATVE